jgi:muramoyltetrapeptide carboxypeptidase
MSRRTFLATSLAASAAGLIPSALQAQSSSKPASSSKSKKKSSSKKPKLLKPKALQAGMTVGLAFPAGWTKMEDVEKGKMYLESLGFRVVLGENAGKAHGYLAAPDKDRAAEFMKLIEQKDVDAVICARGGYGIMRMLPVLDFDSIRRNTKLICGYSDITALINSIYQHSGLVTFHGPGAVAAWDEYTQRNFTALAFADAVKQRSDAKSKLLFEAPLTGLSTTTVTEGKATGRLVGGNLTLISFLHGTPFEIDMKGAILFFEDVTEEPYRIDRMITQLLLAGKLQQCAGIAIGNFTKCEASDPEHSFTIADLLKERLGDLKIPMVTGLQFGHISSKLTYPVGVQVELDATAGTLTLLEEAVTV